MKKLIVASGNKNKIKEIKEIIGGNYEVFSMKDLGFTEEIEETGSTFLENAYIKAKVVSEYFKADVISDDSGLYVEALNGAPGVYSARYSGENTTDKKNNELLLYNMKGITDRRAQFKSCVSLYYSSGNYIYGEGSVEGIILEEEKGNGGFGYDPLFFCNELGKTFGEANSEEKNKISHRFRALIDLKNKIQVKK
jgi:XTP/dITP diphosphohydrolase